MVGCEQLIMCSIPDAAQVNKGSVGDARLRAAAHVQRVDAAKVSEGGVGDLPLALLQSAQELVGGAAQ